MAEIARDDIFNRPQCRLYKWSDVSESDTCEAAVVPFGNDVTFMATGDFGGDGVGLQGSLDPSGSFYMDLNDFDGIPIDLTADGLVPVKENTYLIRPKTPDGTSVSVDCWVLVKG